MPDAKLYPIAEALSDRIKAPLSNGEYLDAVEMVVRMYEAPEWPTEASLQAVSGFVHPTGGDECVREGLRCALLADPIIKAAIPLVKSWETNYYRDSMTADAKALRRAVKEAGLLDD